MLVSPGLARIADLLTPDMSSLRLTTQLQQKMVLTPQLRQRIEMLQMTTLELSDLIQQQLGVGASQ